MKVPPDATPAPPLLMVRAFVVVPPPEPQTAPVDVTTPAICSRQVVPVKLPPLSVRAGVVTVPVNVGEANPALLLICVCMELVASTKAIVVGVTPSSVLAVSVCVSVVPTIVPVGAVRLVPKADPVLTMMPAAG